MKAKKWVLVKPFEGEPKDDDLELVEEELPDLKENEVLLEAVYLSVDPYMRNANKLFNITSSTMFGEQLSRVIKTRNDEFPLGTLVLSNVGWVSHYISDGKGLEKISFDLGKTSPSYCLGALGMPGASAYLGFIKQLEPKEGETIVINGAAGAVGSIVGQLAKIKGVKVIAFVGSDDKLEWCKKDLGFDHVFNYKKVKFSEVIEKVAPDGVEMFFDNVGGEWFHTIVNKHMKKFGRVSACGSIENYNQKEPKLYPPIYPGLIGKHLKIQGFFVSNNKKEWPDYFKELKQYIDQGKIKVKETEYNGFEKMREAFYGLFKGENTGKAIVKA